MTVTITEEQFTAAMREAVQERGEDFVYPRGQDGWRYDDIGDPNMCRYVRADVEEPACIIGTALHKCGVPLEELRRVEGNRAIVAIEETSQTPSSVTFAAQEAQYKQDQMGTWGEALETYETIITNYNNTNA